MTLTFLIFFAVLTLCCVGGYKIYQNRRRRITQLEFRSRVKDREISIQPGVRIVLCSFCKAKNEDHERTCWNCGAKM